MIKIIQKELSYNIIGCVYEMYNEVGYGYREKHYQKILAEIFKERKIYFKRELYGKIIFHNKIIAKYYLDFLIENKIVVELKVAEDFHNQHINQVLSYLKANNLKLGILVLITKSGVKYFRVLNSKYMQK
jgi:GxxExxY protein